MRLFCPRKTCPYTKSGFNYKGSGEYATICPKCRTSVRILNALRKCSNCGNIEGIDSKLRAKCTKCGHDIAIEGTRLTIEELRKYYKKRGKKHGN